MKPLPDGLQLISSSADPAHRFLDPPLYILALWYCRPSILMLANPLIQTFMLTSMLTPMNRTGKVRVYILLYFASNRSHLVSDSISDVRINAFNRRKAKVGSHSRKDRRKGPSHA